MNWPFSTPHVAPLYPALPYPYRRVRKISAFCRCDPAALERFMPGELTLVGDVCEVFVMDAPDAGPLGHYTEAGVVIPARYGEVVGAHVALEYVSSDDSLAAGREIWGYPKKIAEVPFEKTGENRYRGSVIRRGRKLIDMAFAPAEIEFDRPVMQPRLQIKTFAAADGSGMDFYQIVRNDLADIAVAERISGRVELSLGGGDEDPLHALGVDTVIGAETTLTDFLLTSGTILEDLNRAA